MTKFWMVYVDGNRSPECKHEDKGEAMAEAERLAKLNPKCDVHLLECINTCYVSHPVKWTY